MASLREVKTRINSVKSTRKITSAMRMVASAKLHHAEEAVERMLPYQEKLNAILCKFLSTDVTIDSPLLETRRPERVAILVFSSNGSLCGAYNSNILKKLEEVLASYKDLDPENLLLYPIGKRVEETLVKRGYDIVESNQAFADKPNIDIASKLARDLMSQFMAKKIDRVELIYHHFVSMGTQVVTQESLLPLDIKKIKEKAKEETGQSSHTIDYLVEPSVEELLTHLMPQVIIQKLFTVGLDANVSEHAARSLAMQVATDNADDLIHELTIQYNKSRQQAITSELLDIIGGTMR